MPSDSDYLIATPLVSLMKKRTLSAAARYTQDSRAKAAEKPFACASAPMIAGAKPPTARPVLKMKFCAVERASVV